LRVASANGVAPPALPLPFERVVGKRGAYFLEGRLRIRPPFARDAGGFAEGIGFGETADGECEFSSPNVDGRGLIQRRRELEWRTDLTPERDRIRVE
jgi:hypothetical protein